MTKYMGIGILILLALIVWVLIGWAIGSSDCSAQAKTFGVQSYYSVVEGCQKLNADGSYGPMKAR